MSSPDLTRTVGNGSAVRLTSTTTPDEGRFPPGTVIARRYRISARLGAGGMGEVYKASDLLLGQTVAMKFLPEALAADEAMLDRFRNEVRLARQVSHPNVCRVYDIGDADGHLFLTMEFIDGEDLASLLRRIGSLPPAKGLELARRLCAGLAAAHEKGVMHRDLKPSNIMIDGRGQLLITDFGLAAFAGGVTGADVRSGTSAYMSPEQLGGEEVTHKSDLYALGLVLYEIFAGKPPFSAATVGELREKEKAGAPPLGESVKDLDPAIERAVARCLEPDPRRRPASALAMAAALPGGDPLAAALSAGETPSPEMVAAAGEREGLHPRWAAGLFAAFVAAIFALTWLTDRSTIVSVVRLELSPEAMAQKARDVLAGLGYTARPASAAWDYQYDYDAMGRIPRNGGREATAKAAVGRPPVVFFMYRSSPEFLERQTWGEAIVLEGDPPQTKPGMINLRLDPEGRLAALTIKPSDKQEPAASFDWARLFLAAGLDPARFSPAEPEIVPPFAFDARQAWLESGVKEPLRIEAAAWRGKPVFFRMRKKAPASGGRGGSDIAGSIMNIVVIGGVCALAWRNARLGRGDRRGASRAASAMFAVVFCAFLLQQPHALNGGEVGRWLSAAGYALLLAAIFALIYLALEPHVRRSWPHALITWTRLIGGGWRDPLVATHILIGLTAGIIRLLVLQGYFTAKGDVTNTPTLVFANGSFRQAGQLLQGVADALMGIGFVFFLLFISYRLLRNRWLAVVVATGIFTAQGVLGSTDKLESAIVNFIYVGTLCVVMMRYGLLAAIAAHLPSQINVPVTFDSSVWYWGASCAVIAVFVAFAFVAFRLSLAGQPLFKSD